MARKDSKFRRHLKSNYFGNNAESAGLHCLPRERTLTIGGTNLSLALFSEKQFQAGEREFEKG